jgi:hypothetical protein
MIEYIYNKGERGFTRHDMLRLVASGFLPAVEFLHQRVKLPLTGELMESAVNWRQTDMVRYLYENGCRWTADMFYQAIRHRDLPTVKYMYRHGCPHDEFLADRAMSPMDNSTEARHLRQWLRAQRDAASANNPFEPFDCTTGRLHPRPE